MSPSWELCASLLGGTSAMREAGERHLPKWPNEDEKAYKTRLSVAVLFPAFGRTVTTLAGKPFSNPLTLDDDVPETIRKMCEDIDLQGRNLHTFAADVMETALALGQTGILVDFPRKSEEVRTLADERALGLRPYALEIKPHQLRGWRAAYLNGKWVLLQLRFCEWVEEPDGPFATKKVEQIRVLSPGAWETHRKNERDEWVLYEDGTTTLDYIPFLVVYGQRTGFMLSKPPLLELAHLNVAHWQSASDQQTILHTARVPILAVSGIEEGSDFKLTVGASAAVSLPPNGDMKYVEHTGAAIKAGADDLKDLEERMRQAGAELLVLDQKITATQVSTENAVGMCALQRIVQGQEDAIDAMLQTFADWIGEKQGGHCKIFNDFGAATLSDAQAQLIKDFAAAGMLSKETAFHEMQRRGTISPDLKWEDEKDRIDAEGPPLGSLGVEGGMNPPARNANSQ